MKARGKERIRDWRRQVPWPLLVNGKLVCRMVVDFEVHYVDGRVEYVEVKGMQTDVYRLKLKLLRALFPEINYVIV